MERARAAIHAEWEPDALSRSRWSAAHTLKEIEEANPRGGAGGVACAEFRRFAGTCGARPPRARRRRNMGSAGTKRRDEEETWRLDLSGA